jgi:hypothetical protein
MVLGVEVLTILCPLSVAPELATELHVNRTIWMVPVMNILGDESHYCYQILVSYLRSSVLIWSSEKPASVI